MAIFCRYTGFSPLTKAFLGLIPAPEVEDVSFEEKQRAHVLKIAATSKLPVRLLSDLPMAGLAWRIFGNSSLFGTDPHGQTGGMAQNHPKWMAEEPEWVPPSTRSPSVAILHASGWFSDPEIRRLHRPPGAWTPYTMETKSCACSIVQLQCYGSLWI